MNKRSAIALAGGVTGALVSGVVGYAARLPVQAAGATPAQPTVRPALQIRTVTTTVRIKKKARAHPAVGHAPGGAPVRVVAVPASSAATPPPVSHTGGSSSGGGDDGNEHEGGDD